MNALHNSRNLSASKKTNFHVSYQKKRGTQELATQLGYISVSSNSLYSNLKPEHSASSMVSTNLEMEGLVEIPFNPLNKFVGGDCQGK